MSSALTKQASISIAACAACRLVYLLKSFAGNLSTPVQQVYDKAFAKILMRVRARNAARCPYCCCENAGLPRCTWRRLPSVVKMVARQHERRSFVATHHADPRLGPVLLLRSLKRGICTDCRQLWSKPCGWSRKLCMIVTAHCGDQIMTSWPAPGNSTKSGPAGWDDRACDGDRDPDRLRSRAAPALRYGEITALELGPKSSCGAPGTFGRGGSARV